MQPSTLERVFETLCLCKPTMDLGILELYAGDAPAHVSGTATLLHDDEENVQSISKKSAIILVLKPSNSPRDPLVRRLEQHPLR